MSKSKSAPATTQPPETASALYAPLRYVQLLLSSAVIPLGLWGYLNVADPGLDMGFALFPVLIVTAIFVFFVIYFDQFDYPVTTKGALARTGPVVLSFALALWQCGGDVRSASLWSLTSLLASSLAFVIVLVKMQRARGDLQASEFITRALLVLLFVFVLGVGTALFALGSVLVKPLVPSLPTILTGLGWASASISTTRAWVRTSNYATTLNDDGEVKLTDKYKLAEAWGSPMLVAGLSVIGIVVWMLIAKSMK